jgi:predicted RNA-binding Zn ribbon-like protein
MAEALSDEEFLLAILNSTPVVDGVPTDELSDSSQARAWLASLGGTGSAKELQYVTHARHALQAVVRGEEPVEILAPELRAAVLVPSITDGKITWTLSVNPERRLAVQAVLTWDALARQRPGRLRPCANDACRLFLVDRSKTNTARWCSMAICGNRMKARRHYQRSRIGPS